MSRPSPVARAVLAGTLAGCVVGACDGMRSAWGLSLGAAGLLKTISLAVAMDAMLGGAGGMAVGIWMAAHRSGRSGPQPRWARMAVWALAGFASAALAVGAVVMTSTRVNRFLAAAVVCCTLLFAWVAAVALSSAVAAAFGRTRRGGQQQVPGEPAQHIAPAASVVGLWWTAPLVAGLAMLAALMIVWRTRAPLRGPALWERSAWIGALGALGPWLIASAARYPLRSRIPDAWVRSLAIAVPALGAAALLRGRWDRDFQFLPWADFLVALALVLVAGVAYRWLSRPLAPQWLSRSWRKSPWQAFVLWSLFVPVVLAAGSSELARKVMAARGGMVGPALAVAAGWFDSDQDGFARWLGGGDCHDQDADINPGALDWPEDGVDQDCDGADATWAALSSPPFHAVPDAFPKRPNILLVAIDTLRADHVGAYGYRRNTTPVLDALAKQAVVFDNGWAHAPSTRYSMPALFTGRWPSAIEWQDGGFCQTCRSWWPRFSPSNRTLGEALKSGGYFTGSLWAFGYFDADERRGFERGIDVYESQRGRLHTNIAGPAESAGSSAREITDDAVAFVAAHKDKTFFLSVHYYDPHMSYERHPEAPDFGSEPTDLYDGEIWFTDHHLGRLFDTLKAQGLWDNTIILVTGDHGEGFGERGVVAHGYHLYPPQTKVPFIVRVPGLPPRREAAPVSHVDVAPSLVNLTGGAHQPSFLGRSFVDLLTGQVNAEVPVPPVYQEVSYEGDNKKRGIVTRTHHLIWNWTPHNTTECFDLAQGGARDVWGTPAGADVCPPLKAQLRKWLALMALPPDVHQKLAEGVFGSDKTPPVPMLPLQARIGDVLTVVGADVSARDIERGAPVKLALHVRVHERIPEGWRLFFHLTGPGGRFVNLDHPPLSGAYPLDRWRPQQTIVDRHTFTLPPDAPTGTYDLTVGMWRGSERMPVTPPEHNDGTNRLRVFQFEVR